MISKLWKLFTSSFVIWGNARSSLMSAAMTYFTMLSLAPLLVIAIAMAGMFYGDGLAKKEIIDQLTLSTSKEIADIVAGLIANTSRPNSGFIASAVSIAILVLGASGVFSQLQETFNDIWEVPVEQRQGVWLQVKTRLFGMMMVFVAGFLLMTSLCLTTAVASVSDIFADSQHVVTWLEWADRAVSFLLIPIIITMLFWLIPKADVHFNDVWPAGILTALLLSLSRFLIAFYLQYSTTSEVYGAAGSLVVLLIWIYMSGLVLFYGASFSRAWAETVGTRSEAA